MSFNVDFNKKKFLPTLMAFKILGGVLFWADFLLYKAYALVNHFTTTFPVFKNSSIL